MSRRFGRNQRRHLREQLQAERNLRLWGAAEAEPGLRRVEDMGVIRWKLVIDDDGLIEREAHVLVDRAPLDLVNDRALVSFQGARYMITEALMPAPSSFAMRRRHDGAPSRVELHLTGLGA